MIDKWQYYVMGFVLGCVMVGVIWQKRMDRYQSVANPKELFPWTKQLWPGEDPTAENPLMLSISKDYWESKLKDDSTFERWHRVENPDKQGEPWLWVLEVLFQEGPGKIHLLKRQYAKWGVFTMHGGGAVDLPEAIRVVEKQASIWEIEYLGKDPEQLRDFYVQMESREGVERVYPNYIPYYLLKG